MILYIGNDNHFITLVNEYNHVLRLCQSQNVRSASKIKLIKHFESRLYSIIRYALTNLKLWHDQNIPQLTAEINNLIDLQAQLNLQPSEESLDFNKFYANLNNPSIFQIIKAQMSLFLCTFLKVNSNNSSNQLTAETSSGPIVEYLGDFSEFLINIKNKEINPNNILAICNKIRQNITFIRLEIINCQFSDNAFFQLAITLKDKANLAAIEINNINFPDNFLKILIENLLQCCNLISLTLTHNKIKDSYCEDLSSLIATHPAINLINFSNNHISDIGVEAISKKLILNNVIKEIDLSNNYITEIGAKALIKGILNHTSIKIIKLHRNLISGEESDVHMLAYELNRNSSLTAFDISQNFIGSTYNSSDEFKKLTKPRIKLYKQALINNSIFKSESGQVKSHLNLNLLIERDMWAIGLACKKGSEHAMIFIEGLRSFGQCFLQMAHLQLKNATLFGKGEVSTYLYNIENFIKDKTNYNIAARKVKRIQVKKLQKNIARQEEAQTISFSLLSSSSSSQDIAYNCLTWALKHLKSIDVEFEQSLLNSIFPTTSSLIRGNIAKPNDMYLN